MYSRKKWFRPNVSVEKFIIILALYFGFVFNMPAVSKVIAVTAGAKYSYIPYTLPLVLSCVFAIIFSFFTIPYLTKPIFIFLVLTSAVTSYASYSYGTIFNQMLIESMFTTVREAFSYINVKYVLYVSVFGVIPSIIIALVKFDTEKSLKTRLFRRSVLVFLSGALGLLLLAFTYKFYLSIKYSDKRQILDLIVPTHVISTYQYVKRAYFTQKMPYKQLGLDATITPSKNGKPTLVILVLGETARSVNMHYNGYKRNTNPFTKGMGLLSFKDVNTCATLTVKAVPCLFSNFTRQSYDITKMHSQDNALDIMGHAGVSLLWKRNNTADNLVNRRIKSMSFSPSKNKDKLCTQYPCYDGILLKGLTKDIDRMKGKDALITLHLYGSHYPYSLRYPKDMEFFTPSCDDIDICSQQELINTYDNTLRYTDYIIAQTIKILKSYADTYNVALLYIADHGESLGENGVYLHGIPYFMAPDVQKKIPWFMWIPNQYAEAKRIDTLCLKEKAEKGKFSQDNFFHTLLSFYGIKTRLIDENLDILHSCRK